VLLQPCYMTTDTFHEVSSSMSFTFSLFDKISDLHEHDLSQNKNDCPHNNSTTCCLATRISTQKNYEKWQFISTAKKQQIHNNDIDSVVKLYMKWKTNSLTEICPLAKQYSW